MEESCRVCGGSHRHGECTEKQPDFTADMNRIDEVLSGGGDVGNFLSRDLGLLMAADRTLTLEQILDFKAGSLGSLTPERASSQRLIHEKALKKAVDAGILSQSGNRFTLANAGAGRAWLDQKKANGSMNMLIEIGHEFLAEQAGVESTTS